MNNLPKYVVSRTLEKLGWNNSHLIKGNVTEEVSKLKQQPGKDILVFGSADPVHTLMQHDLIDEYRLFGLSCCSREWKTSLWRREQYDLQTCRNKEV